MDSADHDRTDFHHDQHHHRGLLSCETRHRIYNTVMSLYAMVSVAVYVSISATKILAYENFFYHLDEDGFHVASLTIAIAFIVYMLVFATVQKRAVRKSGVWKYQRMVMDHNKVGFHLILDEACTSIKTTKTTLIIRVMPASLSGMERSSLAWGTLPSSPWS